MLTALVVLPVAAAIIVGLIPTRRNEVLLPVGVGLSLLPLALSVYLFTCSPVASQGSSSSSRPIGTGRGAFPGTWGWTGSRSRWSC